MLRFLWYIGTHGTGIGFGNLATLVTGMELITATGEVRDQYSWMIHNN